MRIKDKKRFIVACGGLAIILILSISVLTLGFWNRNETQSELTNQKNSQASTAQTTNTKTEADPATSTQTVETQQPVQTETKNTAVVNGTGTDSITTLVNKNHSITASYIPSDLVTVDLPSTRDTQLRSVAADGLTKLFKAAEESGLELYCCSGYRSYETQSELYAWNVDTYGVDGAELVSARPGMSEHQLGLAMDVTSASVGFDLLESFGATPEGQFIKDNAHKYGFIIRYPQGKTDITGYAYEPWHLRYLGVDVATAIYNSGKTMEEYYGTN
ncbi:D-alanyl-D-alanine carboxypeptidase family protein [Acetobacterium wieringae]|uniref:M15 family metallopeptidase n=1 Tax=Acetobacterium wieringae TaxID=52694 RepID=UPI0026EBD260|nr:M15 family metallopeptidase [Acetobacterium wieringae]